MKRIVDILNKLTPDEIVTLSKILKVKKQSHGSIISKLQTYYGLYLILSNLSSEELSVLNTVNRDTGLIFGEIEKQLGIPTNRIEEIANTLSRRLLAYVLKNRQRLHNKLDKIYIFPEIQELLESSPEESIHDHLEDILKVFEWDNTTTDLLTPIGKNDTLLVNAIYDSGGIITIQEALKTLPVKSLNKSLLKLKKMNIVTVFFDLSHPPVLFLLLTAEAFLAVKKQRSQKEEKKTVVHNHYKVILNLLNAYDTVSSYGLFLTKRGAFRKIDQKRVEESLNTLRDVDGSDFSNESTFKLALFCLSILKCLKTKQDAIVISLKHLENQLENPLRILSTLLRNINSAPHMPLFTPPFPLPSFTALKEIITLILKNTARTVSTLRLLFLIQSLLQSERDSLKDLTRMRGAITDTFNSGFRFLCLAGILDIERDQSSLSDIGYNLCTKLLKIRTTQREHVKEHNKSVYINPDFTLIIPQQELPSEALYHILAHTDITKEDVILHARITKGSIIRAHKRSMTHETFLAMLKQFAKSEIPQNLNFLISEWSDNIVQVRILNPTVIYTNTPSLIDEITFSELKPAIIERISDHYAIIDREYLGEVIKVAHKKDAVIRVFEDVESG